QVLATNAIDVSQTIGQLAGVLATNLGPGRDKLLIRGLSDGAFTGRARSTVSTYLDDAPINYNAPDPDLRLVDVERIEVVRGPQRSNGVREVHNNDFSQVGGALQGDLGWARLASTFAYIHHTYSSQYDAARSTLDLFGAGPLSQDAYVESARTNMLVQDLVLR